MPVDLEHYNTIKYLKAENVSRQTTFELVNIHSLQLRGAPYLVYVNSCTREEQSPSFQQECFHPLPLGNSAVFHPRILQPTTNRVHILKHSMYVQN